eukprot:scaffold289646_cov32-Prasinocladus_malaysianus.AAC.1
MRACSCSGKRTTGVEAGREDTHGETFVRRLQRSMQPFDSPRASILSRMPFTNTAVHKGCPFWVS